MQSILKNYKDNRGRLSVQPRTKPSYVLCLEDSRQRAQPPCPMVYLNLKETGQGSERKKMINLKENLKYKNLRKQFLLITLALQIVSGFDKIHCFEIKLQILKF